MINVVLKPIDLILIFVVTSITAYQNYMSDSNIQLILRFFVTYAAVLGSYVLIIIFTGITKIIFKKLIKGIKKMSRNK